MQSSMRIARGFGAELFRISVKTVELHRARRNEHREARVDARAMT
jgi:hypothetical protein